MTEKINKINNPLTIIAIFAALAEINATIAIGLIDKSLHYIFIWFIIAFPTILVISFFLTLNFNTKVMYSPSDYKEDRSFMDSLFGSNYGDKNSKYLNSEMSRISIELEQKITEKITEKITASKEGANSKLSAEDIATIKQNIKKATDETIKEIKDESLLTVGLKEKMLNFYQFPAFYILIYAIVRSKSKTVTQLNKYSEKLFIPPSWESGAIKRLLSTGIVVGDEVSFSINPEYTLELNKWADENVSIITFMSQRYRRAEDQEDNSQKEKIKSRIVRMATELKF